MWNDPDFWTRLAQTVCRAGEILLDPVSEEDAESTMVQTNVAVLAAVGAVCHAIAATIKETLHAQQ